LTGSSHFPVQGGFLAHENTSAMQCNVNAYVGDPNIVLLFFFMLVSCIWKWISVAYTIYTG